MMKYDCIFPNFYDTEAWKAEQDMTAYYEAQDNYFHELFPENKAVIVHWFDSPFANESYEPSDTDSINDIIEGLAVKDGANLVRFESGNVGFVGYYNGKENGFELIDLYEMAFDIARSDMQNICQTDEDLRNDIYTGDEQALIEYVLESVEEGWIS